MITNEEVGAIQVATILDAQSSTNFDGVYQISLCYYQAREPNMSVSFALTQSDPNNSSGSDPFVYWKQTFGHYGEGGQPEDEEPAKEQGEKGEEEKTRAPKKIEGVGEEAFWSGNRFGGALYVLKNHLILRISVGGGEGEETKIAKSKALAEKAISRL